jgi:PAS domain S-box-containing protein
MSISKTGSLIAETTYQDILECISEALIFADRGGVIRIWNPGAEFVFGHTSDEAVGQSLDLIIPEHLRKAHWDGFNRAVSRGTASYGRRSVITRSLHKSGQQLYVEMSFAVVNNRAGQTIGATAVARNCTERFLEEKNLRRRIAELTAQRPEESGSDG